MNKQETLDRFFTYHAPVGDQAERYTRMRAAARGFALVILESCPKGDDRMAAIRKVREAVFTANAAIACDEARPEEVPKLDLGQILLFRRYCDGPGVRVSYSGDQLSKTQMTWTPADGLQARASKLTQSQEREKIAGAIQVFVESSAQESTCDWGELAD